MGIFERLPKKEPAPKSREQIRIELEEELKNLNDWETQVQGFSERDKAPSSRYADRQILEGISEKKEAIEHKLKELDSSGEN